MVWALEDTGGGECNGEQLLNDTNRSAKLPKIDYLSVEVLVSPRLSSSSLARTDGTKKTNSPSTFYLLYTLLS